MVNSPCSLSRLGAVSVISIVFVVVTVVVVPTAEQRKRVIHRLSAKRQFTHIRPAQRSIRMLLMYVCVRVCMCVCVGMYSVYCLRIGKARSRVVRKEGRVLRLLF